MKLNFVKSIISVAMLAQFSIPSQAAPAGSLLGAVVGGVVGNQIGGGNGNTIATAVGAVVGAQIGDKLSNQPQSFAVVAPPVAVQPMPPPPPPGMQTESRIVNLIKLRSFTRQKAGEWKQILISPAVSLNQIQIRAKNAFLKIHEVQAVNTNANATSISEVSRIMLSAGQATFSNRLNQLGQISAINIRAESFKGFADADIMVISNQDTYLSERVASSISAPVYQQPAPQPVYQQALLHQYLCKIVYNGGSLSGVSGSIYNDKCLAAQSALANCRAGFNFPPEQANAVDLYCSLRPAPGTYYGTTCVDENNQSVSIKNCIGY